jgi:hypothetical protein
VVLRVVGRSSGRPKRTVDNINGLDRPTGTSKAAAHRRLAKDRPDLHARVLKNELSVHAAMIEAGFRHRSVTIRTDDMSAAATALKRQLTNNELSELLWLLMQT